MRTHTSVLAVIPVVLLICAEMAANQRSVVTPAAADIRGFQLTEHHLQKFAQVTRAMDRVPDRGAEAPRADVAMFTVLAMSLAFSEPFTERTVPETAQMIQQHPELAAAVQQSGLSPTDYVLTQIALMLTYPAVAAERQGGAKATPGDLSPANLAFVRANWPAVDVAMQGLMKAVARYAR